MIAVAVGLTLMYQLFKILGLFNPPWPKAALAVELACLVAAIGAGSLFGARGEGREIATSNWFAVWIVWAMLGVLTAATVPGASYLFALPCVAAAIVSVVQIATRFRIGLLDVFPAIVAGCFFLPMERLFYDAVGFGMPLALVVRLTLIASMLWPLSTSIGSVNRRWLVGSCAAGSIISTLVTIIANR